ncbi:MAG: pentapeptide repeat-containing protein [Alphaproteobacteria bacterium]|nr:pentapeptide repeat-containing protein [Alphaproteobacteria bacterium]
MRILSVSGETLFKSSFITIKESVEEAVSEGVDLSNVNLRRVDLSGANLDMAKMSYACLWGADLTNTNFSDANLDHADMRTCILKDTCLSHTTCKEARLHGAYFSKTLINGADFSRAEFSCSSVFTCDLQEAYSLKGAIYHHHGEVECALSEAPLVIRGLAKPIVIMKNDILIGTDHQKRLPISNDQKQIINSLNQKIIQS